MQQQHPDDRFALTDEERAEFRQIWQDLTGDVAARPPAGTGEPGPGTARPGWFVTAVVCTVLVFIGLAANSTFVVLVAAAGVVGAHLANRMR